MNQNIVMDESALIVIKEKELVVRMEQIESFILDILFKFFVIIAIGEILSLVL